MLDYLYVVEKVESWNFRALCANGCFKKIKPKFLKKYYIFWDIREIILKKYYFEGFMYICVHKKIYLYTLRNLDKLEKYSMVPNEKVVLWQIHKYINFLIWSNIGWDMGISIFSWGPKMVSKHFLSIIYHIWKFLRLDYGITIKILLTYLWYKNLSRNKPEGCQRGARRVHNSINVYDYNFHPEWCMLWPVDLEQ